MKTKPNAYSFNNGKHFIIIIISIISIAQNRLAISGNCGAQQHATTYKIPK